MDGEPKLLMIDQICALSGLSEREVRKALSKGDLLDQTPRCVGEWLNARIQTRMTKPKLRVGFRQNREPSTHRKWD